MNTYMNIFYIQPWLCAIILTANRCPMVIANPIARGGDPFTSLSSSAAAA